MGPPPPPERVSDRAFARRALIVSVIAAAVALLVALLWKATHVLLLVFAAILVGVFLRALAVWVNERTRLPLGWSLGLVVALLLAAAALMLWLFSARLSAELALLADSIPKGIADTRARLAQYGWGRHLLAQIPEREGGLARHGQDLLSALAGDFGTALGALVDSVVVAVVGLYLAATPDVYVAGIARLTPHARRERVRRVLGSVGYTLRWWVVGRFGVMAINGAVTAVGLWLLGSPLPFALGLLTGILNFIPNIGPFLAAIPAIMLALGQGPTQALYVAVLFVVVQNLEGFVLTPLVQQRTVSLPPALVLVSQLLLGVLAGGLGVLLATPLAATAMVLVRELYIQDVLGDPVVSPGERSG